MSKRTSKRLAIAALVLVAALASIEIAARIRLGPRFVFGAFTGPPQALCGEYDADLGWRNRANVHTRIAAQGATYDVTINSHGQRGGERDLVKPPGVKRVVLLGDSTAWGWGVDDELMWPHQVEHALPQVEIINLSVPGYGTDQELWALEREGLKFAPDLVLLAFVHNDTLYNGDDDMQGMAKPVFRRGADGAWAIENRPVPLPTSESDLERRYLRRTLSMYLASVKLLEPPTPLPTRYDLDDPKVLAGIERLWNNVADPNGITFMLLGRVREAARAANADLLAFVIPHLVDRYLYDPTTPIPPHDAAVPYETYGTQKLAEAGRALGFETFSIDDALLREVSRGTNLDCGDQHLNERGNQIVAGVVAARLRRWLDRDRQ